MKTLPLSRALIVAATVAATIALSACAGLPPQTGVKFEATITRTTFGIPHIQAADYRGLGFGAGYTRAQDNLCLLADAYVSYTGQRSKFFGANGKTVIGLVPGKNVDSDIYYLAVSDLPAMRSAFARRSSDYRDLVDGWVAGYNRYLKDHKDALPAACAGQPWVREITSDDVLLSLNAFAIQSSSGMFAAQIANAAPPTDAVRLSAVALPSIDDVTLPGSNGWAFGGEATTNGKGLVLANPHFPWLGTNRFYEMQLTIPGRIDVAGAAIVTLPYIGIGFNRDVAWTHTVDMAAHMTLYKLALDPADATAYIVDGRREAMTRREIRIENQDGAPIVRTLYVTRYGPLMSLPGKYEWTKQTAYALADANRGNIRTGDTWLAMGRAKTVRDIRDALARYLGAPFINTMAADRHGDALYADITAVPNVSAERLASCGGIEARLPGMLQELVVLDGSRADCAWAQSPDAAEPGLLPASQMATLYRRDYVQNSNDTYRWSNPAALQQLGPIMGRDPGLGNLRTRSGIAEIRRVLDAGKFDLDVAAQTMFGNKVLVDEIARPALLKLCNRSQARLGAPAEACAALAKWDGKAELDSRGAMLFNQFWLKVASRADIWKVPFDPDDMINTPRDLVTDGKIADELLAALGLAADEMKKLGLAADAPLSVAQFAVRGDERIPISGLQSGGTLNYTKTVPGGDGYLVIFGASYVQSVTFDDDGPVAKANLTYSQSSDPASPHYADQTREFSKKQLHRFPFSATEIAADAIGAPFPLRQ
ncbi:MAG TPA: penicillin acylase family protein [Solimonas sp.]